MIYAVTYTPNRTGYRIVFPDFPDHELDAEKSANLETVSHEKLLAILAGFIEAGKPIPVPVAEPSPTGVKLSLVEGAKVYLHNVTLESRRSQASIAAELGQPRQAMTRLYSLYHPTKIDALQAAFDVLGYDIELSVKPRTRNLGL